jgi:uncharacterized protein
MGKWQRVILLGFCALVCAGGNFRAQTKAYPSVIIRGSEVRTLKAKDTGREYDLYIHRAGAATDGKKYPVLFVLDGQWDFKLMDSVYGGLFYDKFVPEMIIVGITYSGEKPNYDALRAMDYTPTPVKDLAGSGDAAKFLAFLKNEVIPLAEKDYNADPARRVLMGSSFGGLFTLYALFSEPSLFMGYISSSPAVSYDKGYSFTQEKLFAEKRHDLPVKLFISVGEIEFLTKPVKDFAEIVTKRNYTSLKLETRVLEGERHAGNKPEAFNRGLRFIFQAN